MSIVIGLTLKSAAFTSTAPSRTDARKISCADQPLTFPLQTSTRPGVAGSPNDESGAPLGS